MKKTVYFLIFLLIIQSCITLTPEYDDEDCDYLNCITEEPFFAKLYIDFTRDAANPNPQITILDGYFETGHLIEKISTDTVKNNTLIISVPIGKTYTLYTKYVRDNDTIVVIDGATVLKKSYIECDSTCWSIENTYFNLKLK